MLLHGPKRTKSLATDQHAAAQTKVHFSRNGPSTTTSQINAVRHAIDKLQHVEGFSTNVIAAYFPFLPGPPAFWTYLSAAFEIVGSFCITAGIMARPAAALIAGTMVNAIAFHLMKFGAQHFPFNPDAGGAYTYEPSLSFLGVSAYLLVAGPGKLAMRPNGF